MKIEVESRYFICDLVLEISFVCHEMTSLKFDLCVAKECEFSHSHPYFLRNRSNIYFWRIENFIVESWEFPDRKMVRFNINFRLAISFMTFEETVRFHSTFLNLNWIFLDWKVNDRASSLFGLRCHRFSVKFVLIYNNFFLRFRANGLKIRISYITVWIFRKSVQCRRFH